MFLETWVLGFMMRQTGIIVVIYDPVATCVQNKSSVTFYFISDGQIYRLAADFICLASAASSLLNIVILEALLVL